MAAFAGGRRSQRPRLWHLTSVSIHRMPSLGRREAAATVDWTAGRTC